MNRTDLMMKARAAAERVLREKGYISVVEVLLAMGRLSKENHERWRFRQMPHLEMVLPGSLRQHEFFCRELRAFALDELKLKPSRTVYMTWGRGRKERLRFSKTGHPYVEELFSTHYVAVNRNPPSASTPTSPSPAESSGHPPA